MRYAKVRRLEIWLNEPNGLDRDKLREAAAELASGGESDAENRNKDSYCVSKECSMFL